MATRRQPPHPPQRTTSHTLACSWMAGAVRGLGWVYNPSVEPAPTFTQRVPTPPTKQLLFSFFLSSLSFSSKSLSGPLFTYISSSLIDTSFVVFLSLLIS